MFKNYFFKVLLSISAFALIGCGGGGGSSDISDVPSNSQKLILTSSNSKEVAANIANSFAIASLNDYTPDYKLTKVVDAKKLKPLQKIASKFIDVNYKEISNDICLSGTANATQDGNKIRVTFSRCKLKDSKGYIKSGEFIFTFESSDIENSDIIKVEIKDYTADTKDSQGNYVGFKSFNLTATAIDYDISKLEVNGWYKNKCLSGWVKVVSIEPLYIQESDEYIFTTYDGILDIYGRYDKIRLEFFDDAVILTDINGNQEEIQDYINNYYCD